ncbi:MAG: carbon storage regulator [Defluviitaleaceae bacterium]|nr:carbon storage regulator [Defluviitaleaceae bacterium]
MLVINLNEGDYIMIGDNVRINYDHSQGSQVVLAIDAPREIPVKRGKFYEEGLKKLAENGDLAAKQLYDKLQAEFEERQQQAYIRRNRNQHQNNRIAKGEIKPRKHAVKVK